MHGILRWRRVTFTFIIFFVLFILYSIYLKTSLSRTSTNSLSTNHAHRMDSLGDVSDNNIPYVSEIIKDTTHSEKHTLHSIETASQRWTVLLKMHIKDKEVPKARPKTFPGENIISVEFDNLERTRHETPTRSRDLIHWKAIQMKEGKQFQYGLKLHEPTDTTAPLGTIPGKIQRDSEEFLNVDKIETTKGIKKTSPDKDIASIERENLEQTGPETETTTPVNLNVSRDVKKPGLLLDTPACKIPQLEPWDRNVVNFIASIPTLICPGPPLFMKSQPDGSIALNESVLESHYRLKPHEIRCRYQSIRREHEAPQQFRENNFSGSQPKDFEFGVPLGEDYVAVSCRMGGSGSSYFEQYFPLVRLKKELEKERDLIQVSEPRLNVILVGIDSVSKLNFLRYFRRTGAFLKEKMSPFDMNGYTKVADNTFPNLVPMLTGQFVEHYWNESLKDTMFFDDIGLIWKEYAKKGYRTFFAEDSIQAGIFNYLKRGFYDPPTDYYYRPLGLALELSELRNRSQLYCLNSQLETEFLYEYMVEFIKAMESRPYFAFTMVSTLTHDHLSNADWADPPTLRLVENLWNIGALNNSLLVLFSDHGLRFGDYRRTYYGKYEDRMPFMYIYVPKWFQQKYPTFSKNLHRNQDRLMTLFDLHATMVHLLKPNQKMTQNKTVTLGTSLFNEIPSNRSCEDADIRPHWCPCHTLRSVSINTPNVIKAAQAIADDINSQLVPFKQSCVFLQVAEILDASYSAPSDLMLRFEGVRNWVLNKTIVYGNRVQPITDYIITIKTKPGNAEFEGTVRHHPDINWFFVQGISRINVYGTQSWCINSQKLKIFCYCNSQLP